MKRVFVIRHAEAEEPVAAAKARRNDAQRQLTEAGKRDMRKAARGLASLEDGIALILSSPLVRAVETAEILHGAFPQAEFRQEKQLSPGFDPEALLDAIVGETRPVALVGHEPDLSQWIGYMTTGSPRSLARMKKGSVCRLDLGPAAAAGEAQLAWLLTLKQLAKLAP
ncbi:MAG TPA: phosphohistidine phosphatase SixA [Gammaproteobacteria bacterium]|nr:phosphohistidine phosphatase SixA [Gammaproteobacteria bacterium]